METTLTIRLPSKHRKALKRRAVAEKRTESAIVRELIEQEVERGFDFQRAHHLIGSVSSPPRHWQKDHWRRRIRERNWRS